MNINLYRIQNVCNIRIIEIMNAAFHTYNIKFARDVSHLTQEDRQE